MLNQIATGPINPNDYKDSVTTVSSGDGIIIEYKNPAEEAVTEAPITVSTTDNNCTIAISRDDVLWKNDYIVTAGISDLEELRNEVHSKPDVYTVNEFEDIQDMIDVDVCKKGDVFYSMDTKDLYVIVSKDNGDLSAEIVNGSRRKIVNCTNCGGVLDINATCPYCGSKYQ